MKKFIFLFVFFFSAVLYSQNYQNYMTVLGFPDAWNITTGDEDVIIAVLGNGIHTNHPALQNTIFVNPDEIPNNGIDDDGNGFIDDVNGWNFYSNNNNVSESRNGSDYSHETSIAGIIAAQQTVYNNYIVKGLAPSCKIMPVKFYEPDNSDDPQKAQKLANSLNYVRNMQTQYPNKRFLINISFSFNNFNQEELDLVTAAIENCYNADIPIFCSAGNNSGQAVEFPANLYTTLAITIVRGEYFNYIHPNYYPTGNELDLAAPEDIKFTTFNSDNYYQFGQTSGAAPQACAIAALVLSLKPDLPIEELRRILHKNTFTDIYDLTTGTLITFDEEGYNEKVGYGRVDALASLTKHNIVFLNDVEGNTSIGQVTVEGEILNSGDDYPFFRGEEVNTIAYGGTYTYNNFVNKFYNWNWWDFENGSSRDQINRFFSDLFFDDQIENTTAFFKKTTQLTVRNYFEGADGGIIKFGEWGTYALPDDFQDRISGYVENAFIYNPQGGVNLSYRAEAYPSHNLLNTTWNFFSWENGSMNRIREEQITQTTPLEWKAQYKGINRSDDIAAYDNNSQRKFVRTGNGHLHSVYTSLGALWYERSTDNGQTWEIMNSGKPLNNSNPKGASIDYIPAGVNSSDIVLITYQYQTSSGSKVVADVFINGEPRIWNDYEFDVVSFDHSPGEYDNMNTEPVVAINPSYDVNANFLIVYKLPGFLPLNGGNSPSDPGLYYSHGHLEPVLNYKLVWDYLNKDKLVPNTGINSIHPTIADNVDGSQSNDIFHLAYEDNLNIYYWFCWGTTNALSQISHSENISTGTGSLTNTNPSISIANAHPVISWTGEFKNVAEKRVAKDKSSLLIKEVVVRRGEIIIDNDPRSIWSNIQKTGGDVNFTNNNSAIDAENEYTVITWDEGITPVTKWFKRSNGVYGFNHLLDPVSGVQTQVSDGNTLQEMTAMIFNTDNVPYLFTKSTSDFNVSDMPGGGGNMNKITDGCQLTYGREGIVTKGGVEFVFNIGDIFVGDSVIEFTTRPDTLLVDSEAELNGAVRTEDFALDENSSFLFTNFYYVIHQEYADSVLTEDDQVNFKAELVNAGTNQVAGTYDNITYNIYNLLEYNNIDYQVDCSGIEPGEYYLRLTTSVQGDAAYTLANIQEDNTDLNKKNYRKVLFNGESLPETYELSQNYPNPFNPSTTIRYQLPQDGLVTLKIYDILGREITTLVNEEKTKGRYEVNFNAQNLASGVYLYSIKVNDYVAVKKMLLLK